MRQSSIFILLLTAVTSCQFFETEKISTQTFYEEELKAINWNDIDQYPVFPECDGLSEKTEQEACFKSVLTKVFYEAANEHVLSISTTFKDTVLLKFTISDSAELAVKEIVMDSMISRIIPNLEAALRRRVDSLKLNAPAYKRGIPVRTEFMLPIVITTDDL